jgi:hypothetical protein
MTHRHNPSQILVRQHQRTSEKCGRSFIKNLRPRKNTTRVTNQKYTVSLGRIQNQSPRQHRITITGNNVIKRIDLKSSSNPWSPGGKQCLIIHNRTHPDSELEENAYDLLHVLKKHIDGARKISESPAPARLPQRSSTESESMRASAYVRL